MRARLGANAAAMRRTMAQLRATSPRFLVVRQSVFVASRRNTDAFNCSPSTPPSHHTGSIAFPCV
eukprot:354954-Chlamydomonas_euryale.AAC.7